MCTVSPQLHEQLCEQGCAVCGEWRWEWSPSVLEMIASGKSQKCQVAMTHTARIAAIGYVDLIELIRDAVDGDSTARAGAGCRRHSKPCQL